MTKRFDDGLAGVQLPAAAMGETPGICAIAAGAEGWGLTRRSLLGLIATAGVAIPLRCRAAGCSDGAFAHASLLDSLCFFPARARGARGGRARARTADSAWHGALVSAGRDGFVKFWTIPDGALFQTVATPDIPFQAVVSPDGKWVAVAMDGGHLELWSAAGDTRRALVGHTAGVTGVAFTPDSSEVVSVSVDRTTKVWSVTEAKLIASFKDAAEVMARVGVAPPGEYLVTSGGRLYVRLFATGMTVATAAGRAFAISRDGRMLAAKDGNRLYLYALPSLQAIGSVANNGSAASLSFSADGKWLAVAYSDVPARLYSVPDLTLVRALEANEGPCLAAAMDSRNDFFAVASGRTIRLYELPSGSRVPVCFMDIAASPQSASGSQYILGGIVFTVPCGAPLPSAAVCTCNCVPGNCACVDDQGCACVSDQGCACVSDSGCSCDGDTGCACDSDYGCACDSDNGCGCVADAGCSCDSDYGCGCVDDTGCGCVGDSGCGCDGDSGCGCDGE